MIRAVPHRRGCDGLTDEHPPYRGLPNHQAVKHSVGEYVNGQASTNGVEPFWRNSSVGTTASITA